MPAGDPPRGDAAETDAAAVSAYLRRHPRFLLQHEEALASQELPCNSDGKVVQFAEKQAQLLRRRYMELRHSMSQKVQWAMENERLFESARRLVLDLMGVQGLGDLLAILTASLEDDFAVEASSLLLLGDPERADGAARVVSVEQARRAFPRVVEDLVPICGILRDAELEFLFPANHGVGSAVIAPVADGRLIGLLAIGSSDPEHFRSGMGTLFLSYICDVLGRLLPRFHDTDSTDGHGESAGES